MKVDLCMSTPIPTEARDVTFPGADTMLRGVLVEPARGALPARGGIVLFPDVRGISETYRRAAARIAGFGTAVLLLDPYSRKGVPELPDMATTLRWIASLPDERVLGDVEAAVAHLGTVPAVGGGRTGILGFCLGGQYAIQAACRIPSLAACVSFYGMLRYAERNERKPASPLDLAPGLACPLLGLYGADDPLVPVEDRAALEAVLRRGKQPFGLHVFGGAAHAFANDARPEAFRPESAAVAWQLVEAFLARHLA